MNTISTREVIVALSQNKQISLPSGTEPHSYDFEDHEKIDWDKPRFGPMGNPQFDGFENLIDQHCNAGKISEHLNPKPPVQEPIPPVPPVQEPVPPVPAPPQE